MYSMAYDPRTAAALAQEHIDRQLGIAAVHATARSARRTRVSERNVEAPVPTRPLLRMSLTELARRATMAGARLRARAS